MRGLLITLALWVATPVAAATIVIDFEAEAPGNRGSSFVASCGCAAFSGWRDRELAIVTFDGSQALRVGEEGGSLAIDLLVPVHTVFLDFGNDVDDEENTGSVAALLVGLRGGEVVGFDTVVANRNGAIDQTLALSGGGVIEQLFFAFPQAGEFEPISPVVDRLRLVTVPEPGTLVLLAVALAGAAAHRRHL